MSAPVRRTVTPRWWRATGPLLNLFGRWSVPLVCGGSGLVLPGCADLIAQIQGNGQTESPIDEQREDGWNVGGEARALAFPGAQTVDATGGMRWREVMWNLASHLAPAESRWTPYANPTLFQALEAPRNAELAAIIRPVFTPAMAAAAARGTALLSLLTEGGACRRDVAVVLDLPGPEAVAMAAALAPCLDPVFVFANWPHPLGVVPAHLTLGAALYELPLFEQQHNIRPPAAAPVFVLDRNRLAPYVDDAGAFDNRYFANLPPHGVLRAAGIAHVLYVTDDAPTGRESDDLNDDLVALDQGGLDVQMLSLADFSETPLPGWPDLPLPGGAPMFASGTGPHFYFGGSAGTHACFWDWYGWSHHTPMTAAPVVRGAPPAALVARCHFHPALRVTVYSSSHGGHPAPGHGPMLGHASFGRSGSLGRASSGMSG